jgi:hypothetical protein
MIRYTEEAVAMARQYRLDAIADGWLSEPLSRHEAEERWARLSRGGFVMHVIARTPQARTEHLIETKNYEAAVNVWGPDGLVIVPPAKYDWAAIVASTRTCPECKATDVPTFRYTFAGRACATCLPEMKRKHETPGWEN